MTLKLTQPQADMVRKLRQGATLIRPRGERPLIRLPGAPNASYAREETVRALEEAGVIRLGERRDRFQNRLFELTPEAPQV